VFDNGGSHKGLLTYPGVEEVDSDDHPNDLEGLQLFFFFSLVPVLHSECDVPAAWLSLRPPFSGKRRSYNDQSTAAVAFCSAFQPAVSLSLSVPVRRESLSQYWALRPACTLRSLLQ
jgi:hypothetical protein